MLQMSKIFTEQHSQQIRHHQGYGNILTFSSTKAKLKMSPFRKTKSGV